MDVLKNKKLARPHWHQPEHRLWDDFCNAMVPAQLMEADWIQYQEAHDHQELPEVAAAIDHIKDLLQSETVPLPGPIKKSRVKRPTRVRRPKRA